MEGIYDCEFNNNNKMLIMTLFMQFFSCKFDDRLDSLIKFKDIQSIAEATWKLLDKKANFILMI